ncbi:hypothetical protein [Vibrio gangliei]|uniref:hypothetical protein n=1 Tax=Vibrio gangliei TaxID=2077090 RepID=UPI000D020EE6|nr:hypothetical protein [Vibrio gangliei]
MSAHSSLKTETDHSEQLEQLIDHLVDLEPKQLKKVQVFIDDMVAEQDFSSPVLTEQEKLTLEKMFQL